MSNPNQDQHYNVSIILNGNEKVSFVTTLGWEEHATVKVDAVNVKGVRQVVEKFFKQRGVVPFEYCTSNECQVGEAEKSISVIQEMIANECWSEQDGVLFSTENEDGIYVAIEINKSYVVNFDEQKPIDQ